MRTVAIPTRWLGSILACVTALAWSASATAQDAAPPPADAPSVPAGDEAPEAPPPDEGATAEPELSPEDEAAIAEAEQAEIDAALAEDAPHCNGTGVEGVVRDTDTRETLIEAPVIVVGRGTRTMTDYDGRFAIDLPPGTYTLRSYYDLYEPTRVENIRVRRGECTRVEIELATQTTEGEEVVIEVRADTGSEATVLRERREAVTVQDGVSAEEIRRSPDSDAGQAARRIVGATVLGGQYLFVRGLGGRYTAVLLDGAYLPSTDPDEPGVQLDLFPSAILNGLTVMKTFTPDLPGDAAGGTMVISTRDYPSRFQLGVSLTLGANSATSFQEGPMGSGGGLDWLGYDDGTRSIPRGTRTRTLDWNGEDPQTVERARLFRSESWRTGRGIRGPNGRFGINFGDTLLLGDRRLGYFFSFGYGASTQALPAEALTTITGPPTGPPMPGVTLTRESTQTTTQLASLGSMNLELTEHDELQLTLMWTQLSENYIGTLTGRDVENDQDTRYTRQRFVTRSLYFGQLRGEHRALPFHMRARWAVSGSLSRRDEPDTRDVIYGANEGSDTYVFQDDPSSGTRFFFDLQSIELGGSLDFTLPIETASVRFGGAFRTNERTFGFRRFRQQLDPFGFDSNVLVLPPEELFSRQQIGENTIVQEYTQRTDGYFATQQLEAGYAMLDWPVFPWGRIVGGARVESFRQTVDPRLPTSTMVERSDEVYRTQVDVLGSAGLIFTLTEGMYVRANYGTTVARPQIRELAPFVYPDFIRQRNIFGDPTLTRTRIDNFDLRWEYFFSPSELVAVTGFAKRFESPIEMVALGNSTFSYRNVDSGFNAGGEVEGRFGFGRFTDALRFFDIGANFTLVYSEVLLTDAQRASSTSSRRPLAGQSPYVVNVSLGFTLPDANLSLRVYYNVFGERLVEVGIMGYPDIYQQPFHSLDVTAVWGFAPGLELRAAVENLLYDDYVLTQGPAVALQYNAGISGSLTMSWRPE